MNLKFWKKSPDQDNLLNRDAFAPYEEIDSKRTSKLGYFFLILMVIFGVWQGNSFLSSVQDSIDKPEQNSTCLSTLSRYANITTVYSYGYNSYREQNTPCVFSEREIQYGIEVAYNAISPYLSQSASLSAQVQSLESVISKLEQQREQGLKNYNTALIEDIAKTSGVLDTNTYGGNITSIDSQLNSLNRDLEGKKRSLTSVTNQLEVTASGYQSAIKDTDLAYQHDYKIYKLKQFALSFVLVVPVFFLIWTRYNRARERRSEYAIIWGGLVATFGLIVAQILLVFVYEVLPKELIQALFSFLSMFELLWVLLYWLGFILVPLFFGFLIYLIQKKFYNKQAVLMRAIKSGHCPSCSLKITPHMNHCPVCGFSLKIKCESCQSMKMNGGTFCETCGVKN